jgi:hypothetical protein
MNGISRMHVIFYTYEGKAILWEPGDLEVFLTFALYTAFGRLEFENHHSFSKISPDPSVENTPMPSCKVSLLMTSTQEQFFIVKQEIHYVICCKFLSASPSMLLSVLCNFAAGCGVRRCWSVQLLDELCKMH